MPDVYDGSLAWGDFNNDGRLDFLVTGASNTNVVSQLWRNTTAQTDSAPAAPSGLSSTVSNSTVTLTWNAPLDDRTPTAGLTYNLRVGTTPGGSDVLSAPALANGRLLLPQMGSARNRSARLHQLRPGQTYYWSVQAVDTAFAGSPFAPEQRFSTSPLLLNPVRRPGGMIELNFTAAPGARFNVLATRMVKAVDARA